MAYDKASIKSAGEALADLIVALGDGVGADDIPEGTAFLVAIAAQVPSFIEDTDAAILAFLSGLTDKLSDAKRDVVPA